MPTSPGVQDHFPGTAIENYTQYILNPSGYPNSGDFAPSGNGLYGVCRVRDALSQRIYVYSLGATKCFFAVSAVKMDFRGSEVGSSVLAERHRLI